jgi:uncharacterized membrane protein YhaH (DUF805 family)
MKYKHVFFTWLLADIFLALGLLGFFIYEQIKGQSTDDVGMFVLVAFYGLCVSLPSLLLMTLFYFLFTKKMQDNYKKTYVLLIVGINLLYLLISILFFNMPQEFGFFYIATTGAGLLSFYIVDKKIKKLQPVLSE